MEEIKYSDITCKLDGNIILHPLSVAYIYRCPECGGKLEVTTLTGTGTSPLIKLRECQGCTAIYELEDRALLPYIFHVANQIRT